jgi:hypothetical protein
MFCRSRNAAATHSSNSLALGAAETDAATAHNIARVRELLAGPKPQANLPMPMLRITTSRHVHVAAAA